MKYKFKQKINIKDFLKEYFISDKSDDKINLSKVWGKHQNEVVLFATLAVFAMVMIWSSLNDVCRPLVPQSDIEVYKSLGRYESTIITENETDLININSSGKYELKSLDGISDKLAERILNYRYENGKFNSVYDLLEIEGLSRATLEKFINNITL